MNFVSIRTNEDQGPNTWMDRVAAEGIAATRPARIAALGKAYRVFDFRSPGTFEEVSRPRPLEWYETPTVGALPPVPITRIQ